MRVAGVLLAGGQSRRMGGGDKCLQRIGGQPLLAHVIGRLAPQCASLLLSANGDASRFADFGLPVIADDVPGFAGPLAGLLAGLDFIAAHHPETAWALSAAADTPFLPVDLVIRLHTARKEASVSLACARSGGRIHPTIALWSVALRHDLRRALVDEDLRKVEAFQARYPRAYADWAIAPDDPFFNINTPEDLATAEALMARSGA